MSSIEQSINRRQFLRLAALAGGAAGVTSLVAGCTPSAPPAAAPTSAAAPTAAQAPKPAGTGAPAPAAAPATTQAVAPATGAVRFGISNTPLIADPHRQQTSYDYFVYANVMDRLVELDPDTLAPKPSLATSWRAVDDTTYELKLRQGVKFHDGTPFDATAAKKNLDRMREAASTKSFTTRWNSVEAPDPQTILLKLKEPYAYTMFNLGFYQMSLISPATFDKGDEWLATHAVGTGAYTLKDWVAKQRIVLERNPDYWGGAAKVSQVIFQVTPDENARLAALKSGELDFVMDPPVPSVKGLLSDPAISVLKLPVARTYFMMYQLQDPVLSNVKFRQALSMAVNRQALVDFVTEGLNRLANNIIAPEALDGKATAPGITIEYNPDKAKALLSESGVDLSKAIRIVPEMSIAGAKDTAQAIQQDLKKVGITAEILNLENAQIQQQYKDATYQIGPQSWLAVDPDSALRRIFSKRSPWHYPNLEDPTFEDKVDKASVILDDAKRQAAYKDIFTDLLSSAAYTPLYHKLAIVASSKKVQGLRWSPYDVALLRDVTISG